MKTTPNRWRGDHAGLALCRRPGGERTGRCPIHARRVRRGLADCALVPPTDVLSAEAACQRGGSAPPRATSPARSPSTTRPSGLTLVTPRPSRTAATPGALRDLDGAFADYDAAIVL